MAMRSILDGHKLAAAADIGSDFNFMFLRCVEKEGFYVDMGEEFR
jgi:hypothetical protein